MTLISRHVKWNLEHAHITEAEAARMRPDVVAAELTRLYRRLAEAEFLLSMRELDGEDGGSAVPDELRHAWPSDEYRLVNCDEDG
jgi:hypothetical protein